MKAKKKKIMDMAMKVFGEKGFKDATISQIASSAGVGDATIYEHFKNKETLLQSIPSEFTDLLIDDFNHHLLGIKGTFNKLRKFVWWWLDYMEKNPGYGTITLLELKTSRNFLKTKGYQKAREFYNLLTVILQEGQDDGSIKKEINIYLARSIIIGALEHNIIRWLLKDRKYSLIAYADELVEFFINMLKPESCESTLISS